MWRRESLPAFLGVVEPFSSINTRFVEHRSDTWTKAKCRLDVLLVHGIILSSCQIAGNTLVMAYPFCVPVHCTFYRPTLRYNAARAVYKERKPVWDGINPNLLARPPSNTTTSSSGSSVNNRERRKRDEAQASQYRLWKRRLAYERSNPEVRMDDVPL